MRLISKASAVGHLTNCNFQIIALIQTIIMCLTDERIYGDFGLVIHVSSSRNVCNIPDYIDGLVMCEYIAIHVFSVLVEILNNIIYCLSYDIIWNVAGFSRERYVQNCRAIFTCHNSWLLTLATFKKEQHPYHYQVRMWASAEASSYEKESWADVDLKCPTFLVK